MIKKFELKSLSVPVIGISRFRLGTDGEGITTLVAFQGCPLRCSYCPNKDCWEPADHFKHYTPKELYDEVKKDDLYFRVNDIAKLEKGLLEKLDNKIEISEEIKKMIDQNKDSKSGRDNEEHILEGDMILPSGLSENPDYNIEGEIQEFHDDTLDGQVLQGEQVPKNPDYYQYKKYSLKSVL